MIVAATAYFYALKLAAVYLLEFMRSNRRKFVAQHVFWLTAGLAVNAGLAIATEVGNVGQNNTVNWKEWLRLQAHVFIVIGLVPLWKEHCRRVDRNGET